ncbi:MAG: DUF1616 domain-containing protein [Chloroflexi bacterium]|nr:DUF1616 domain-containing protein [Chloroflexota bacterium]
MSRVTPGRSTLGLVALAAVALVCGWLLTRPDLAPGTEAIAGALLGLGVPGLAWVRALFPRRTLDRAERWALVLGIQLALLVVTGFLLHLSRPGLSSASWGAFLADISLVACLVAWWRERRASRGDGRPAVVRSTPLFAAAPTSQLLMLLAAAMVVVVAFAVARVGVLVQPDPPWTSLAIVPADGGSVVQVAIHNAEGIDETYRLVLSADDVPFQTLDGLEVVDDGLMIRTVELPPAGSFLREVRADLWRATDDPAGAPHRSVGVAIRGGVGP